MTLKKTKQKKKTSVWKYPGSDILKECNRCRYEYYIPKGGRCPNCGWPV